MVHLLWRLHWSVRDCFDLLDQLLGGDGLILLDQRKRRRGLLGMTRSMWMIQKDAPGGGGILAVHIVVSGSSCAKSAR